MTNSINDLEKNLIVGDAVDIKQQSRTSWHLLVHTLGYSRY